jgi:hypothetical protein
MTSNKSTPKIPREVLEKPAVAISEIRANLKKACEQFTAMQAVITLFVEAGEGTRNLVDVADVGNGLASILTQIQVLVGDAYIRLGNMVCDGQGNVIEAPKGGE